ncbi:MAG: polyprenol monophosphomannose synthase [Gemmatimonadetes bacterium]|nr:polyprenol monophosphomannose synthase [Gemmatimonadota bacterium]
MTSAGWRAYAVTRNRTFTCGGSPAGVCCTSVPRYRLPPDVSSTLPLRPLQRALVIVPTYNERENLPRLVPSILSRDVRLEILVVDDGSPDGTGAMADEMAAAERRVHVLHRAGKLGLGTAYLAGFAWGLERGYDLFVQMDADFSHDPAHLPQFLSAVESYDLVLGSRYLEGRVTVVNWPIARLLLSYYANVYARWVTGLPVADATGGFKCFRREVLATLDLSRVESNGYSFQIEMSFRAWKLGFRIGEIPIMFVDRDQGESKMSKSIVREAIWRVWRLRLLSTFGRLHSARLPGGTPPSDPPALPGDTPAPPAP